jgi:hypothetical protein
MAQSNTTDQFFHDQLQGLEMTPSAAAWDQVQSGLSHNKTIKLFPILGIAAAVAIVVVATLVIFRTNEKEQTYLAGVNDHPTDHRIELAPISVPQQPEPVKNRIKNTKRPFVAHAEPTFKNDIKLTEIVAPETKMIAVELPVVAAPQIISTQSAPLQENTLTPIKITYIAKSENPESDPIMEKINKVMEVARGTSPAEILADIRDAKMNLLRRN